MFYCSLWEGYRFLQIPLLFGRISIVFGLLHLGCECYLLYSFLFIVCVRVPAPEPRRFRSNNGLS